jgi:hypothetical protein
MWRALLREYAHRYARAHACEKLIDVLAEAPSNILDDDMTTPALAMPDEFKVQSAIESYRNYYLGAKSRMLTWKKRDTPHWVSSSSLAA